MRKHAFAGQNTQQAYTSKMMYVLNPNDMSFNMTQKEKIIKNRCAKSIYYAMQICHANLRVQQFKLLFRLENYKFNIFEITF